MKLLFFCKFCQEIYKNLNTYLCKKIIKSILKFSIRIEFKPSCSVKSLSLFRTKDGSFYIFKTYVTCMKICTLKIKN